MTCSIGVEVEIAWPVSANESASAMVPTAVTRHAARVPRVKISPPAITAVEAAPSSHPHPQKVVWSSGAIGIDSPSPIMNPCARSRPTIANASATVAQRASRRVDGTTVDTSR